MLLTVLLTAGGMAVIIVDKGVRPIKGQVTHALVGLATVVLAAVQPLLAMVRCGPQHR